MNLKEVELSFDIEHWIDDEVDLNHIPKKVKDWCERYFLHKYEAGWSEDWDSIKVSIFNIPQSTITWLLLATENVTIVNQFNYAPIPEEVLELFDFGDKV